VGHLQPFQEVRGGRGLPDRRPALVLREAAAYAAGEQLALGRGAVEREFGRLENDWALSPLRVRGLDRVRLHADLTILAKLACTLTQTQDVALAA
jgi:hypothetical protein